MRGIRHAARPRSTASRVSATPPLPGIATLPARRSPIFARIHRGDERPAWPPRSRHLGGRAPANGSIARRTARRAGRPPKGEPSTERVSRDLEVYVRQGAGTAQAPSGRRERLIVAPPKGPQGERALPGPHAQNEPIAMTVNLRKTLIDQRSEPR